MSLVLTKAALALKNAESNFQVVKFEAHKPKKKNDNESDINLNKKEPQIPQSKKDVDLKKIRHEIVRFGMSGFSGTKKEEAKIALAISLGAKPPKREYINYKELMEKRKQEKQKLQNEKQLMMSKTVLHTVKKKKKGVNNDVGHLLSSYGKVQKKDLKQKSDKGSGKKKKK
ncbi:hypothetical protein KGM_208808 [Danaus plexippus plexippus]|uniref:Uncharacterized protein n=1 Tax=Danaus plexippus plexippus TaxID=278856 RepID=A0A212EMH7_DANPL|nr:hypothetical protein KGM_208808 [Danaus plexippus plexippus]